MQTLNTFCKRDDALILEIQKVGKSMNGLIKIHILGIILIWRKSFQLRSDIGNNKIIN